MPFPWKGGTLKKIKCMVSESLQKWLRENIKGMAIQTDSSWNKSSSVQGGSDFNMNAGCGHKQESPLHREASHIKQVREL